MVCPSGFGFRVSDCFRPLQRIPRFHKDCFGTSFDPVLGVHGSRMTRLGVQRLNIV